MSITLAELRAFYPGLAAAAEGTIQNPVDPDTAAWLDGPTFARWFRVEVLRLPPEGPQGVDYDTNLERTLRAWADGRAVTLQAADEALVRHGRHLHELPENVWRHPPKHPRWTRNATKNRPAIEAAIRAGERPSAIAKRFGISDRTVRVIRKRLEAA